MRASEKSFESESGSLCSAMILTMPLAARRRAKRIFGAGGLESEGEHAGDGVGLVGDGEHGAFESRRHGVVHRLGLVVVVDGVADGFGGRVRQERIEVLHLGVESADDALEFGEFLDEVGGEIGFAEQSGLVHDAGADGDASGSRGSPR